MNLKHFEEHDEFISPLWSAFTAEAQQEILDALGMTPEDVEKTNWDVYGLGMIMIPNPNESDDNEYSDEY